MFDAEAILKAVSDSDTSMKLRVMDLKARNKRVSSFKRHGWK